jgi:hypothetical protein
MHAARRVIVIDTDIGDDGDDAFGLALAPSTRSTGTSIAGWL